MKKTVRTFLILIAVIVVLATIVVVVAPGLGGMNSPETTGDDTPGVSTVPELRGVWVATVYGLDFPSSTTLDTDAMKAEIDAQIASAVSMGFNAIFLQVCPCCDAIYPSEIYPTSAYLVGTQGGELPADFDPLEYWITAAHENELSLHAWINPYRVTAGGTADSPKTLASLSEKNPARQHPEYTVSHVDGNLYLDPGLPAVRELILSGIREICEKYDVDGIHFDDYFYPYDSADLFDDGATYAEYGAEYDDIAEFRRESVNALIREVGEYCRSKKVIFGVGTFGIWRNEATDPLGSATSGMESYDRLYADSRAWVKNEWVDYIAPQIYWEIGYSVADYAILVDWWADVTEGTSVQLIVGHAGYRVSQATDPESPWYGETGADEILHQIEYARGFQTYGGSIHFRLNLYKGTVLEQKLAEFYADEGLAVAKKAKEYTSVLGSNFILGKLRVGSPENGFSTASATYYVQGTSDPSVPLYMNGEPIADRTEQGTYGLLVALSEGENTFLFAQDGQDDVSLTITRVAASNPSTTNFQTADKLDFSGEVTPKKDTLGSPGDTMNLICTAPIGATVTAVIGNETIRLWPADTEAPDADQIYLTTFSAAYTFVGDSAYAGRLKDLGKVTYRMTCDRRTSSVQSAGSVRVIEPDCVVTATVTSPMAFTYSTFTSTGDSNGYLCRGMTGRVTCTNGEWARLDGGLWIPCEYLEIDTEGSFGARMTGIGYEVGKTDDALRFQLDGNALAQVSVDDNGDLLINFRGVVDAGEIVMDESLFSSAKLTFDEESGVTTYHLTPAKVIDGWWTETDDFAIIVHFKHHITVDENAAKPLSGLVIMLDPGHGGTDIGAVGSLGSLASEKDCNLIAVKYLRRELMKLGATVVLTRAGDCSVPLVNRLSLSWSIKPDLLISLHSNSFDRTTDISDIHGIVTLYRETLSADFAEIIHNGLTNPSSVPARTSRGLREQNLYICRGTWCPHILIEMGFLSSPQDFDWMLSVQGQTELASSIASSVVDYFSK